jgi:hypothetical protein
LNAGRLWSEASGEATVARQKRAWAAKKWKWAQVGFGVLVVLGVVLSWWFD